MEAKGCRVLRFWSHEGMENLEEVLPKILEMGVRVQLGSGTAFQRWRAVFYAGTYNYHC
ncbi:PDDEXK family nuclease [Levilinea saccharolytica]|uniref:hypothetical protein n=1 Tax=Levilinea saccharolytica TaxID=229921 RepID=UPI000DE92535